MTKALEKKVCIQCGSEFMAKRSDARFCSPNCRQKFVRAGDQQTSPEEPRKEEIVPTPKKVTVKRKKGSKNKVNHTKEIQNQEFILPGELGEVSIGGDIRPIKQVYKKNDGSVTVTIGPKEFDANQLPNSIKDEYDPFRNPIAMAKMGLKNKEDKKQ